MARVWLVFPCSLHHMWNATKLTLFCILHFAVIFQLGKTSNKIESCTVSVVGYLCMFERGVYLLSGASDDSFPDNTGNRKENAHLSDVFLLLPRRTLPACSVKVVVSTVVLFANLVLNHDRRAVFSLLLLLLLPAHRLLRRPSTIGCEVKQQTKLN